MVILIETDYMKLYYFREMYISVHEYVSTCVECQKKHHTGKRHPYRRYR